MVDKLFQEVNTPKLMERSSANKSEMSCCSIEEEDCSRDLEPINEQSENDHSYLLRESRSSFENKSPAMREDSEGNEEEEVENN